MIGSPPPAAPGGAPASPVSPQFQTEIKGMSDQELKDKLKDPNLTDAERAAIIDELAKRKSEENKAEKASGDTGAGEEEDEMQKLLKKLKDGTITEEELEKLAGMLGVDPKDLEKKKGKGDGGDGNN
jgi:hypothetical protein